MSAVHRAMLAGCGLSMACSSSSGASPSGSAAPARPAMTEPPTMVASLAVPREKPPVPTDRPSVVSASASAGVADAGAPPSDEPARPWVGDALTPDADADAVVFDRAFGLASIPVCKATLDDVRKQFGEPTRTIQYGTFSTEYDFAAGVDLIVRQGDAAQRAVAVTIHAPMHAYIDVHGTKIVLGRTTAKEAQTLVGGTTSWETTDAALTWKVSVPSARHDGELDLLVARDLSLPQFPLDKARHEARPVVGFEVFVGQDGCPGAPGSSPGH